MRAGTYPDPNGDSAAFRCYCAYRGLDPRAEPSVEWWAKIKPDTRRRWRIAAEAAQSIDAEPRTPA